MTISDMKRIVNSQEMYDDTAEAIQKARRDAIMLCRQYNKNVNDVSIYDRKILENLLGSIGKQAFIESNFRSEFGFNIYIGDNVYINHDMIILDCNEVRIGHDVYIGSRVGIYTGNHAEDPIERADGGVYAKPVTIGDKVWLCGDVKIAQDVTIGENSIIGMGSVVLNDIPSNVLAAGNPCKVIRPIKESDVRWHK